MGSVKSFFFFKTVLILGSRDNRRTVFPFNNSD